MVSSQEVKTSAVNILRDYSHHLIMNNGQVTLGKLKDLILELFQREP